MTWFFAHLTGSIILLLAFESRVLDKKESFFRICHVLGAVKFGVDATGL